MAAAPTALPLPGTTGQLLVYSTHRLEMQVGPRQEWLEPHVSGSLNNPESCRLIPNLQDEPVLQNNAAAVPIFK